MANKMLIDAAHPEETRVVVVRGNRVEDFDFESASRKQLRGNIYLAKVTRVEPSLQAAFVDYGGNRHGFLAFSEIHPDYYQIPVADRQALIEAEEREIAEADERAARAEARRAQKQAGSATVAGRVEDEAEAGAETEAAGHENGHPAESLEASDVAAGSGDEPESSEDEGELAAGGVETVEADDTVETVGGGVETVEDDDTVETVGGDQAAEGLASEASVEPEVVESVGAEDALEEVPERRRIRPRQYKIQEVIKRRQVLLVQVVKEERGTKGAALTTYLSLAGRYCVLMPNTARGGGISRKITSLADRKRLKQVAQDLEVPEGMGVILRTAGASRTKAEVKRDFEYLLRLWENVRELTLKSTAPTLVYEEGSLIKRSIRDLYNKDIDEILVAGEEAYREAKDFMRMLMPSHAKNVQPYREKAPIFARYGVEAQLDAMFSPQVTLKSGGYLVINQTEALVSIDVNSGRSTREHNIEDTAYQTNLEAAEEIARQLRLRDLAGLIVIDFIDMEEKRNNRAVERKLKEALKNDRARIQVGRISHFGLLEMSRQRIRTGVVESTTEVCPHCQGTGHVRSPSSVALHVLRSLEEHLLKNASYNLNVRTRTPVALYILNQKRSHLMELEQRFGLSISITADDTVTSGGHFVLERGSLVQARPTPAAATVQPDSVAVDFEETAEPPEAAETAVAEAEEPAAEATTEPGERRRRRRRRRGRRGEGERPAAPLAARPAAESETVRMPAEAEERAEAGPSGEATAGATAEGRPSGEPRRRRRRGRRGGRRANRHRNGERADTIAPGTSEAAPAPSGEVLLAAASVEEEWPDLIGDIATEDEAASETGAEREESASEAPADWQGGSAAPSGDEPTSSTPPAHEPHGEFGRGASPTQAEHDLDKPKRGGWWQRRSFF
jgi:ribonuclease E